MRAEAGLTKRETQIAELLAWGAAKKEVADRLSISPRTVENTARNIYSKIGIQKATELCVWWFCTHCGVSFDLSPIKRTIIACFFLAIILPHEMYGQGVYRSAYKNARRLAVTEMNAAYRRAEWESYQNNPLIIGYEIILSNNHTTTVNGKVKRLVDICDKLAGRYPKTFRWTGWHPHCRCEMVPIFISESDFRERIRARKAGKLKDWKPNQKQEVKQVPKALTDWIVQNEERSKGWQTLPYFVRDNRKSIGTLPVNTYTAEERKFTRARSTAEAMERATQLLSTLYPDIQNTELAALHHYTQQGGNYRQLNKQLDKGGLTDFNKASASLMAKALEGLPKYRGTVYRGAIMKRKDYERLYAGKDEVKHAIFTSSTKTPAVAYRFASYRDLKKTEVRVLFEIQSKNGRDISDISEFNGKFAPEDQREVLFTNGTGFKIVKHEISGQEVRITLVEL